MHLLFSFHDKFMNCIPSCGWSVLGTEIPRVVPLLVHLFVYVPYYVPSPFTILLLISSRFPIFHFLQHPITTTTDKIETTSSFKKDFSTLYSFRTLRYFFTRYFSRLSPSIVRGHVSVIPSLQTTYISFRYDGYTDLVPISPPVPVQ